MIKHYFIGLIIRSQELEWKSEASKGQSWNSDSHISAGGLGKPASHLPLWASTPIDSLASGKSNGQSRPNCKASPALYFASLPFYHFDHYFLLLLSLWNTTRNFSVISALNVSLDLVNKLQHTQSCDPFSSAMLVSKRRKVTIYCSQRNCECLCFFS